MCVLQAGVVVGTRLVLVLVRRVRLPLGDVAPVLLHLVEIFHVESLGEGVAGVVLIRLRDLHDCIPMVVEARLRHQIFEELAVKGESVEQHDLPAQLQVVLDEQVQHGAGLGVAKRLDRADGVPVHGGVVRQILGCELGADQRRGQQGFGADLGAGGRRRLVGGLRGAVGSGAEDQL